VTDDRPGLMTPRTLRTFGGGAIVAGAACVFAPWHPLAGAVSCAVGIAALWRASVAEDEERRRMRR